MVVGRRIGVVQPVDMPDLWLPRRSRREFLRVAGAAGVAAAAPWPAARAQSPEAAFEAVPAARSGITWVHDNAMSPDRYLPETLGPGCAFLDYDNDGWMDIYLVNSGPCDFFKPAKPLRNALYQNNRDGTFTDVTEKAGVARRHVRHGRRRRRLRQRRLARPVRHAPTANCILYHNNGDGTFTDVTEKAGLRDARLDHQRRLVRLRQRRPPRSVRLQLRRFYAQEQRLLRRQQARDSRYYCIPRVFKPTPSFLYHNNGDGTFTRRQQRHRHRSARSARVSAWSRPTSITTAGWTCSSPTTRCRTSCS